MGVPARYCDCRSVSDLASVLNLTRQKMLARLRASELERCAWHPHRWVVAA